jgi:hypothetical protein
MNVEDTNNVTIHRKEKNPERVAWGKKLSTMNKLRHEKKKDLEKTEKSETEKSWEFSSNRNYSYCWRNWSVCVF